MSKLKIFIVGCIFFGSFVIIKLVLIDRIPRLNFDKNFKIFPGIRDVCEPRRQNTSVEDLLCMDVPKFLKNYKNPCWMENNKTLRCQPYFHLIGNAKCGTSDFFKRVLMHPDIVKNKGILNKETAYWSRRRFGYIHGRHGGRYIEKATFNSFLNKFQAEKMQSVKNAEGYHYKVTGVGDPMDFYDRFHDNWMPQNQRNAEELQWTTIHAIKHLNPNVKLILMLRDPVERLYSYYFFSNFGNSSEQFHRDTIQSIRLWNACLKRHSERHCMYSRELETQYNCPIYPGMYNILLREWLNVFPRDQILIFRTEDYEKDIRGTMINVFHYLNLSIPDDAILQKMSSMEHFRTTVSKRKAGAMLNETRKILVDFYRPYLKDLAYLLNDDRYLFNDVNFK